MIVALWKLQLTFFFKKNTWAYRNSLFDFIHTYNSKFILRMDEKLIIAFAFRNVVDAWDDSNVWPVPIVRRIDLADLSALVSENKWVAGSSLVFAKTNWTYNMW